MEVLILGVGIIIGVLISWSKNNQEKIMGNIKEYMENKGISQFIEPENFKEKFNKSHDLDDFVK